MSRQPAGPRYALFLLVMDEHLHEIRRDAVMVCRKFGTVQYILDYSTTSEVKRGENVVPNAQSFTPSMVNNDSLGVSCVCGAPIVYVTAFTASLVVKAAMMYSLP